jgi:DNA-binding LytR/AlgR family response regulator
MKKKSSAGKVKKKAHGYSRIPGMWIMNTSGALKIDHEDILYCHHGNDVTKIFYLSGRFANAHVPLIKLEQRLCGKKFYRCHRNYIINLNYMNPHVTVVTQKDMNKPGGSIRLKH